MKIRTLFVPFIVTMMFICLNLGQLMVVDGWIYNHWMSKWCAESHVTGMLLIASGLFGGTVALKPHCRNPRLRRWSMSYAAIIGGVMTLHGVVQFFLPTPMPELPMWLGAFVIHAFVLVAAVWVYPLFYGRMVEPETAR